MRVEWGTNEPEKGEPVSHASFDKRGAYFVPLWLERLFWAAFIQHFLVSAFFVGWFVENRSTVFSAIRFLWLSLTYTIIACAFHAACNIPRPYILYYNVNDTVKEVVKNSFVHGLSVGVPLSAVVIGIEIYGW